MHQNARLTPKGRELSIKRLERGEYLEDVACVMGVSVRTVYKWRRRYREEGLSGVQDRSLPSLKSPAQTEDAAEAQVIALRRQKHIYDLIAEQTGLSRATVGHVYTKPYTPKTNGKAERVIQSSLRKWAYSQAYDTSEKRKKELPYWLQH